MPNPNPKMSPEFLAKMNPKIEGVELAKPIGVRFPVEDLEFLNSLPDRGQFIRDAVHEAIAKAKQAEEPSTPTEATPEKKRTGRKPKAKTMQQQAIATVAADEPSFKPGDCCKMPSGHRVYVEKRLEDGRYAVTWEATRDDDVVPAHLLTLVNRAN